LKETRDEQERERLEREREGFLKQKAEDEQNQAKLAQMQE